MLAFGDGAVPCSSVSGGTSVITSRGREVFFMGFSVPNSAMYQFRNARRSAYREQGPLPLRWLYCADKYFAIHGQSTSGGRQAHLRYQAWP